MSHHTPGPWEVREERVGDRLVRRVIHDHNRSGRGHKPIATVHEGFTRTEADAYLIAAAPDLLAACEAAFPKLHGTLSDRGLWPHQIGYECDGYQVYEQVRRALAKAGSEVTP